MLVMLVGILVMNEQEEISEISVMLSGGTGNSVRMVIEEKKVTGEEIELVLMQLIVVLFKEHGGDGGREGGQNTNVMEKKREKRRIKCYKLELIISKQ